MKGVRCSARAGRRLAGAIAAALCLAGVARGQDEVPFITTPDQVTLAMLELAAVGPADHVIDLGSGDGRIVITAARRFGARGLGVEIVPDLVRRSRDAARAAGVAGRVEFREQDLFATDLGRASVVTMYLLPAVNLQLRPRLLALAPGTRVVSHDWDMGDWSPDRTLTVDVPDKAVGREKLSRVHLWVVPAAVHGTWCAPGIRLDVTQRFQTFSATLVSGDSPAPLLVFDGRIEGSTLRAHGAPAFELKAEGDVLRQRGGGAAPAPGWPAQAVFQRATSGRCR
ncbi:MAG: methyltransferase domain-containing protein [Burkholderiales bacterium]|nr:methyltransferase domain-containing protein [Burkholderiales bacterium]